MRDEGFNTPYGLLNVARTADTETVEATFARLYKAARRLPDSDLRRQELNSALEVLRQMDRRAQAEVTCYHIPLEPHAVVPTAETLTQELLTMALPTPENPAAALPQARAGDLVESLLSELPERPTPDDRALLRQLAARVALELLDPWAAS